MFRQPKRLRQSGTVSMTFKYDDVGIDLLPYPSDFISKNQKLGISILCFKKFEGSNYFRRNISSIPILKHRIAASYTHQKLFLKIRNP